MNEVLINEKPRPRLLIWGLKDFEPVVQEVLSLAPTSKRIQHLTEIRQVEWDILVTDYPLTQVISSMTAGVKIIPKIRDHICVIYVASGDVDVIDRGEDWNGAFGHRSGHIAGELKRIKNLPDRIEILCRDQLEPVARERDSHTVFNIKKYGEKEGNLPSIDPFLLTADDQILAGRYRRNDHAEVWLLPSDVVKLADWVQAALAEWSSLAPQRFPGVPDWSHDPKWMTIDELALHARLDEIKEERRVALLELEEEELQLMTSVQIARDKADEFERGLLTAQSEKLAEIVSKVLAELGFDITNADAFAAPDDLLEDLHIKDPSDPGWIALAEVKGYAKGAQTYAMTQFLRFNTRFIQKTGSAPNASWYIVNQFVGRDPSIRPRVLHGKDEDISAFASAGGLVIDTALLFRLLAEVRSGARTAEETRLLMRSSTGRLEIPQ